MTWLQWLADAYTAVIWPLIVLTIVLTAWWQDFPLFRCAVVVGMGQLAIDIWARLFMTPETPQPVIPLLVVYTVQAVAVTVLPASRTCFRLGGAFICGVAVSIIHLCQPFSTATEWLYWGNNVLIAVATVLCLAGGVAGEGGKRVLHYFGWRPADVAGQSAAAGPS